MVAIGRFGNRISMAGNWIRPPPPTMESMKPARSDEAQTRKRSIRRLKTKTLQPQRVRNHGDGAQAHRDSRNHRTKQPAEERIENAGGDRDSERVVNEREEKVLPDVPHDGTAKMNRVDDAVQVAFHESDPGAFHGNIGAGSHRDP